MSHRRAPDAEREVAQHRQGTVDAVVDLAMDIENTCRIPRDELLGLLNTMTPIEKQRITAEMPVVELPPEIADEMAAATPAAELAAEVPAAPPPADLVIKFREPSRVKMTSTRMFVIGASFAVSFGLGLVVALL